MFRILFAMLIIFLSGCSEDSSTSTTEKNIIDTTKNYTKINALIEDLSKAFAKGSREYSLIAIVPFPNNDGGGFTVKGKVQSIEDAIILLGFVNLDYGAFELNIDNVEMDWQVEVGDQGIVSLEALREKEAQDLRSSPTGIVFY